MPFAFLTSNADRLYGKLKTFRFDKLGLGTEIPSLETEKNLAFGNITFSYDFICSQARIYAFRRKILCEIMYSIVQWNF